MYNIPKDKNDEVQGEYHLSLVPNVYNMYKSLFTNTVMPCITLTHLLPCRESRVQTLQG